MVDRKYINNKNNICVLYGGVSSERNVSISTAKTVINSIKDQFNLFSYDFKGDLNLLYQSVKKYELVFNALHGGQGENGAVQKILESNGIKFTGSGSEASEIAMDKNTAKCLCKKYDIPTPKWFIASPDDFNSKKQLFNNIEEFKEFIVYLVKNHAGLVIKPNNEGSSVGVTIFKEIESQNERFNKQNELMGKVTLKGMEISGAMMWEEYIQGREVTVSILDNTVLPIVEIIPKGDYYDYKSKYTQFQSDYVVPAKIDSKTEKLLSFYSLKMHKSIGCRGYSRLDYRLTEDGEIYFLEINTLPGLTDTSLLPKSAQEYGINYNKLINKIIELAI